MKGLGRAVARGWNRFFFDPVNPASLGVFRAAFGALVLLSLIGKFPDRALMYGDQAILSEQAVRSLLGGSGLAALPLEWVPGSDPALALFLVALMAVAALVSLGLFTRVATVLLFLGLLALGDRGFAFDNAGDELLRIQSFFLMFAPAGAAFSLDGLRRGRAPDRAEPRRVSAWAFRCLQLQLSYVYLDTVFLKLHGQAWLDGTAVYYALHYDELRRFPLEGWLPNLTLVRLATWATLAIEGAMATLLWVPRLRYACLAAALGLHLTLNLAFQFPVFQYVMIVSLLLFARPEDVERAYSSIARRRRAFSMRLSR